MARDYDPELLELEEEYGDEWGSGLMDKREAESVQLPPLDPSPFGGNSQLSTSARQLAQLYATRVASTEAERRYRAALQAAERAARRARANVAAARAAVPRPDPGQIQRQVAVEYEAWLTGDYQHTIEGARTRFGLKWLKQMRRLADPNQRQAYYTGQLDQVSRAWLIARREQVDFRTLATPGVRPLPASFRPPAAEVRRQVTPLVEGSQEDPLAPEVIRFVQELKNRYRGFSASTYRNHGGGPFLRRGYSVDLFLNSPLDGRGFYRRQDAEAFLRKVHEAAKAANVEWRALYNDFSVADAINRAMGVQHVGFIGAPVTAQRRDGTKYGINLNWHGPHPLILHFHLDLVPIAAAAAPGIQPSETIGQTADAVRRGRWSLAIRLAIQRGVRDENRLTDLVFYARHPELRGRRLRADERRLIQEWLDIRDRLVRPALRAFSARGAPVTPTAPAKPSWVRTVVPLLDKYRGDIPRYFLLGWIAFESGGRIGEITASKNERGYFQNDPGESQRLRLDHDRLSRDPDYSVWGGIQLVKMRVKEAQAYGFKYGSDLFWGIVKLRHWLPLGINVIVKDMRKQGFKPATWDDFKAYVISNQQRLAGLIKDEYTMKRPKYRSWKLPPKWHPKVGIDTVDKVFKLGQELAAGLANP